MTEYFITIRASIRYDGTRVRPCIIGGVGYNVRLPQMPDRHFLPNLNFRMEEVIQFGEEGTAEIDLIVPEQIDTLLVPGAEITLHDGPRILLAHGTVEEILSKEVKPPVTKGIESVLAWYRPR